MLIVLEGCDGAGKTTLAQRLADLAKREGVGYRCVAAGPPDPDVNLLLDYGSRVFGYDPLEERSDIVVLDRLHLGELVYGPVYRGGSRLTDTGVRIIESMLDARGALKLHLTAPDDVLERRAFDDRGEDFVTRTDIPRIAAAYRDLVGTLRRWVTCDTGNDPIRVERLVSIARLQATAAFNYWERLSA